MTNNPTFDAWFATIPGPLAPSAPDAAATNAIAASERPQEAAFSLTAPRVRAALAVFSSIFGVRPSIRVTRATPETATLFPAVLTLTSGEGALFLSTGDATGTRPYAVIGLRSPEGVLFTPNHPALAAVESAILMRPEVGGALLNDVQVLGLAAPQADREALATAALHTLTVSDTPALARDAVWFELVGALSTAQFSILADNVTPKEAEDVTRVSAFILGVRARDLDAETTDSLTAQARQTGAMAARVMGDILRNTAAALLPPPATASTVADKDVLS